MVGWHHLLNRHESAQMPGIVEGQSSQECCSPWDGTFRHDLATEQMLKYFEELLG